MEILNLVILIIINLNIFYNQYHKDGKGNVFTTKDGHKVLAGKVFSFKRLVSKITPNSNGAFNELIGYGKTIDILYGGVYTWT